MVKDIHKDKLPVSGINCLLHKAVQNWLDKSEETYERGQTALPRGNHKTCSCEPYGSHDVSQQTAKDWQYSGRYWVFTKVSLQHNT